MTLQELITKYKTVLKYVDFCETCTMNSYKIYRFLERLIAELEDVQEAESRGAGTPTSEG